MANIMSQKNVRNHVHRNGFDLSFRNAFTAKPGQILPVFMKETLPGDKWTIDVDSFTRTQPVQTAAFTRIQEYYDFYFVPTSLLWDKFDNYIVQTNNYNHASGLGKSPTSLQNHPFMTMQSVVSYLTTLRQLENQGDYEAFDIFGMSRRENSLRLLNYLGYGDVEQLIASPGRWNDFSLNIFPLLAYQKVCQDYFRFSQWETSKPYLYNLDYVFNQSQMNIPVDQYAGPVHRAKQSIFDLQYCNYKKDMITGLLPSPQFGDTAIASPLVGQQRVGVTRINLLDGSTNIKDGFIADITANDRFNQPQSLGLSVFALRFAEVSQKWKEITQSGSLDFKEQIQKHWNVSVSDDSSYMSRWLGGTSNNIAINEVVNNNISSEDSQALIAGKGIGSSSKRGVVHFDCKHYGYIIGVYHAVPLLDWSDVGIERSMLKTTASDYAIPEFDNIGMEEVPNVLLDLSSVARELPFGTLGYAPRYYDYKMSQDKIRGAFLHGLRDWAAPISQTLTDTFTEGLDWRAFKVSPSALDSIFLPQAHADSSYDSDPFLVGAFFDTKVVRNLSVDGLPY